MNRRIWKNLGKLFLCEVAGRMYQPPKHGSTPKFIAELIDLGFVAEREETYGRGAFAVLCKGFVLTPVGHFEYCSNCEKYDAAKEK
jgi:hypothetical protein